MVDGEEVQDAFQQAEGHSDTLTSGRVVEEDEGRKDERINKVQLPCWEFNMITWYRSFNELWQILPHLSLWC